MNSGIRFAPIKVKPNGGRGSGVSQNGVVAGANTSTSGKRKSQRAATVVTSVPVVSTPIPAVLPCTEEADSTNALFSNLSIKTSGKSILAIDALGFRNSRPSSVSSSDTLY